MTPAAVLILNLFILLMRGQTAPIEIESFTDDKHNVSVSLLVGVPKNYQSGKVRVEFEFGKPCTPATSKLQQKKSATLEVFEVTEITQEFFPEVVTDSTPIQTDQPHVIDSSVIPAKEILNRDCNDSPFNDVQDTGIYKIYLNDLFYNAVCEILPDGRKFLVFQRRLDGSEDFERDWESYSNGFGKATGEYWLGNDFLHHVTSSGSYTLRIELETFNNTFAYAEYDVFKVGSPDDDYKLNVSGYSGNAGDSLSPHNGMKFTTEDADNDVEQKLNCAKIYKGGWWYTHCYYANLNGLFYEDDYISAGDGISWYHLTGHHYSLKSTKMMLTRRSDI